MVRIFDKFNIVQKKKWVDKEISKTKLSTIYSYVVWTLNNYIDWSKYELVRP